MLIKKIATVLVFGILWIGTIESAKTKVLIVTSVFPKLSEPFILDQAQGLIKQGIDVYIHAKSGDLDKTHPDVKKSGLIERTYYKELPPDIDTYDVILCQFGPRGKDFVKIKKERKLKAKVVTYFRGYDITEYVNKHGKNCYDELFKDGDLFIANCEHFKRSAMALGCPEDKILVHYSAMDLRTFYYSPRVHTPGEPIRFISSGRLVEKKGFDYALYAFDQIRRRYPNVEYHIAGDGYFKKRLLRLVDELQLHDCVTFTGAYSSDELVPILQAGDIFLGPSITAKNKNQDAIPNTLKEAMAIGIPVISTLHGGIPEMIEDDVDGFLVPERDADALADCMEYLIKNPSIWKEIGKNGRKKVSAMFDTRRLNVRLGEILKTAAAHDDPRVEHFSGIPPLK